MSSGQGNSGDSINIFIAAVLAHANPWLIILPIGYNRPGSRQKTTDVRDAFRPEPASTPESQAFTPGFLRDPDLLQLPPQRLFSKGQFFKYVTAAQMYLRHELPRERLLDFSPGYLRLHILFQRAFANPDLAMQVLHIVLVAVASLLLFRILLRFFRTSLALIGSIALSRAPGGSGLGYV